ncbi:tail fiber protein [Pseudomonas phage REC]|nr:tail fiber protein [Pseudomonas phage REC]UGL62677.1 putative tail fiber protein [Pseudomonas phage REC1]
MANITKPSGLSNIWANGGTKIDPGAAKVNIGWVVQLPPYEYQNWVDNRQDQAIAHFSQHGIPEWDSVTEYQGLLSYTQGSDGIIYKCLQTNTGKDPSNTLNGQYWAVAFETYGSVAVVSAALAAHITNYQTLSAVGNPTAARANLSLYSKAESDTRFASKNGSSAQVFAVAVATQPEHAVRLGQVSGLLTQATESTTGVVRLATTGLTEAGTDDLTAITPLKASTVYLKKSGNLAGLTNVVTARSNLGLGTMATQNVGAFLQVANNLSDLNNPATARANLGLTSTATQPETYFLRVANNLGDITNAAIARSNLGLTSTAVTPIGQLLQAGNNLSDLLNVGAARNNLGLADTATMGSGNFMFRGNNLGDVANVQTARNNLGLGNAAVMNVFGATGLDFTASLVANGWTRLPNGLIMQWGNTPHGDIANYTDYPVTFPIQFNQVFTALALEGGLQPCAVNVINLTNAGFTARILESNGVVISGITRWFAIGV